MHRKFILKIPCIWEFKSLNSPSRLKAVVCTWATRLAVWWNLSFKATDQIHRHYLMHCLYFRHQHFSNEISNLWLWEDSKLTFFGPNQKLSHTANKPAIFKCFQGGVHWFFKFSLCLSGILILPSQKIIFTFLNKALCCSDIILG